MQNPGCSGCSSVVHWFSCNGALRSRSSSKTSRSSSRSAATVVCYQPALDTDILRVPIWRLTPNPPKEGVGLAS